MRRITFDIETKNFFEDVGKNDPALLDIALVAIHDSATDAYASYLDSELGNLWPVIERADALIGFNSDHFDIPLLNKYYPGDLTAIKSIDIMKSVKDSLGRRLSLNNLAQATLGRGKIADGLQASQWWKIGEIEKIRKYCIEDVRLTKELYDYALKHGKLIYRDGPDTREVLIDSKPWTDTDGHAMTHTLGF
jgi:DEAD/DEAH box helicase domain-containing protein